MQVCRKLKALLSVVAVIILMIGAQSAMASQKPYWTATDKNIQPDMKAYHLFIDGVNPVWGQNGTSNKKIMQLSHDGLKLCLGDYNNDLEPIPKLSSCRLQYNSLNILKQNSFLTSFHIYQKFSEPVMPGVGSFYNPSSFSMIMITVSDPYH